MFKDRRHAGQQLASALADYAGRDDLVILALPRGGVPVAFEIAQALEAPMDVMLVRKLGTPGNPELAMGAIASGGATVMNAEIVAARGISDEAISAVAKKEKMELARREQAYRGDRPPLDVKDKTVILVDDGVATGATMKAAVSALKQLGPATIVVAIPTGARDTCEELRESADDVICLEMPVPYYAVGMSYVLFDQTGDDEVTELLRLTAHQTAKEKGGTQ